MDTATRPSSSICAGTCPAARLTNCGRMAPNRMTALGLATPTMKPSRIARNGGRSDVSGPAAMVSSCRCRMAWTPSQMR